MVGETFLGYFFKSEESETRGGISMGLGIQLEGFPVAWLTYKFDCSAVLVTMEFKRKMEGSNMY